MAKSKKLEYEAGRDRLEDEDNISRADKQLIFEFLDANDPNRNTYQMPDGQNKTYGTLARYASSLRQVTRSLPKSLPNTTVYDINTLMDDYLNGDVEGVKDQGLTSGSVRNLQGPMRRFYIYHNDIGVNADDIIFADQEEPSVDPRDIFATEDVQKIRDEAKRRGSRNACLVDLLLYTGQRRSAILNLRLKDVLPDEGIFYLNVSEGDLKGASGKRPLLGAQKSVRDWKRQHPTGDPEDYLITTTMLDSPQTTPGDKLSPSATRNQLKRIGKAVDISKPINPHQFRHYFVTVCKRNYGMDDATIKHLIGHKPDSTVMESTYQHLTDEDYIKDAEEKFGIREPEEDSPLTPSVCDVCQEPLENSWHSCPHCGTDYTPKAHQTRRNIENSMWDEKSEVKSDSRKEEAINDLREILQENPEMVEDLLNES